MATWREEGNQPWVISNVESLRQTEASANILM